LVIYIARNYEQQSTENENDIASLKETQHIIFHYRSFLGDTPYNTK